MALAAIIGVITSAGAGSRSPFVLIFGAVCCLCGLLSLLLAGICGISGNKEVAKALLLSAGITFLTGTGVCSTMLLDLK
jgi:hypothetical protein